MAWKAALTALAVLVGVVVPGCGAGKDALQEIHKARSGDIDVVVLARGPSLKQSTDTFILEFRRAADGAAVDVGTVRLTASMPMPGQAPMMGEIAITPQGGGRYSVTSRLGMAGTWTMHVEWTGPAGSGTAMFSTPAN